MAPNDRGILADLWKSVGERKLTFWLSDNKAPGLHASAAILPSSLPPSTTGRADQRKFEHHAKSTRYLPLHGDCAIPTPYSACFTAPVKHMEKRSPPGPQLPRTYPFHPAFPT